MIHIRSTLNKTQMFQLIPGGAMQLSYRGVCYQRQELISETMSAETVGIYCEIDGCKNASYSTKIPYAIARLTYRGVSYSQIVWVRMLPLSE